MYMQESVGLKHSCLRQFHTQTLQCLCIALIKILLMSTQKKSRNKVWSNLFWF